MEKAESGDILLFKTRDKGAALIRAATLSNYDHVAMIVKDINAPNKVFYVESAENNGVSKRKWEFLRTCVGKNKFYESVTFRHVYFDRSNIYNQTELFLKQVLGKRYSLSASKMLSRKT